MKATRFISAYCVIAVVTGLAFVGMFILLFSLPGPDDTAPLGGMDLHIDARTGCHYLSRRNGGLTPRLQADGRQLCEGV